MVERIFSEMVDHLVQKRPKGEVVPLREVSVGVHQMPLRYASLPASSCGYERVLRP
jgi:hypothetical protein